MALEQKNQERNRLCTVTLRQLKIIQLSDERYIDTFLPQKSVFGDRIWFTTQCSSVASFFYSDNWGKTWTKRELPPVEPFEVVYPHKGLRWCRGSGTEPYVIELSQNKMITIIRTPLDCFYKSYSYDGGDTWSTPPCSLPSILNWTSAISAPNLCASISTIIPNKIPLSSRLEMSPSSSSEWHFLAPQDYPISFCNAPPTATPKDFTSSF